MGVGVGVGGHGSFRVDVTCERDGASREGAEARPAGPLRRIQHDATAPTAHPRQTGQATKCITRTASTPSALTPERLCGCAGFRRRHLALAPLWASAWRPRASRRRCTQNVKSVTAQRPHTYYMRNTRTDRAPCGRRVWSGRYKGPTCVPLQSLHRGCIRVGTAGTRVKASGTTIDVAHTHGTVARGVLRHVGRAGALADATELHEELSSALTCEPPHRGHHALATHG